MGEESALAGKSFGVSERDGLFDAEGTRDCAAQSGKMRSTTEDLAKLVGNGTDVSTSRDTHVEGGEFPIEREDRELGDVDSGGFELWRFSRTGDFIGGLAADLLRGDGRRKLVDLAGISRGRTAKIFEREGWVRGLGRRNAFGV